MTFTKRAFAAAAALMILLSLCASALAVTPADYNPDTPSVLETDHLYAESAFLVDLDTGEILLSKNSRVRVYPASTTKIMTLLLALESDIPLNQTVTIPKEAADIPAGSSVIGIKPGDKMTWEDLLYGFMLRSGNDGSNAIAVLVSGSIQAFVNQMNLRAMQLGCEGTHFVNAHGYHDQDHYTTAQDLARISYAGMQNETFRQIVGTGHRDITINRGGKERTGDVENRNSLLLTESKYYYNGANGIKTGHHSKAGRCVVASASRNGVNLLAVVMDCATEERQWADAHKLFDYGFSQYVPYSMAEILNRMQSEICNVTIDNAIETDVNGGRMLLGYGSIASGDVRRMVQRNSDAAMQRVFEDVRASLSYDWKRELVAPVEAGESLGTVSFTAPTGETVTAELLASRSIEAKPEPTPSPTPTPAPKPTAKHNVRADTDAGAESGAESDHNAILVRIILLLLVLAVLLLIGLLLYAHKRKERMKREAARKRAINRRKQAARRKGAEKHRSE